MAREEALKRSKALAAQVVEEARIAAQTRPLTPEEEIALEYAERAEAAAAAGVEEELAPAAAVAPEPVAPPPPTAGGRPAIRFAEELVRQPLEALKPPERRKGGPPSKAAEHEAAARGGAEEEEGRRSPHPACRGGRGGRRRVLGPDPVTWQRRSRSCAPNTCRCARASRAGARKRSAGWCAWCGRRRGRVELDATGKKNGRGAYVHETRGCWDEALKKDRLARALKVAVPAEDMEQLKAHAETLAAQD